MIIFDGVSIDSVAPVAIEDIKVSPIRLSPIVRPRAINWGSEFVRMRGGERTISVTFSLLQQNMIERQESIINIAKWAKSDAEHNLELPIDHMRYLTCVCTERPEPSTRVWWENKLRLVFTCFSNPYWSSKAVKTFYLSDANPLTVFIQGDAPPRMRITRANTSGGTMVRAFTVDGETISFNSSLPTGTLRIDVNNQIATVGNNSAMQYYEPTSTFFIPHTGSQTIQAANTYFYYRERWQ